MKKLKKCNRQDLQNASILPEHSKLVQMPDQKSGPPANKHEMHNIRRMINFYYLLKTLNYIVEKYYVLHHKPNMLVGSLQFIEKNIHWYISGDSKFWHGGPAFVSQHLECHPQKKI